MTVSFWVDFIILAEMQRPTKGNDNDDGGQQKKAILLPQGCVQLEEAVQSFYPVTQYSSRYIGPSGRSIRRKI